jgi:hypothetical protein
MCISLFTSFVKRVLRGESKSIIHPSIPVEASTYIQSESGVRLGEGRALAIESCQLDAVLIDDSTYNHKFWQYAAKKSTKALKCFRGLPDFDREAEQIPIDTPIYIDLNLQDGVCGLDVAANLRHRGFEKLYITTASVSFSNKDYPWLSGVNDKTPPFNF